MVVSQFESRSRRRAGVYVASRPERPLGSSQTRASNTHYIGSLKKQVRPPRQEPNPLPQVSRLGSPATSEGDRANPMGSR